MRPDAAYLLVWLTTAALVGMAISNGGAGVDDIVTGPLPRYKRRRRPPKHDLGLAPDDVLEDFARCYLRYARGLWPDLSKDGLLPEPTDEVTGAMVDDFKRRHRTGKIDDRALAQFVDRKLTLAAIYPRYSDDNSQAKSIPDQARQILQKAKGQGCFVPWALVFADYARSATFGVRQGYSSLINVMKSRMDIVDTVFVDDFQRCSRDDKEWWRFAGICKNCSIHLYGASDGFDLEGENWEMKLQMFSAYPKSPSPVLRGGVRGGVFNVLG